MEYLGNFDYFLGLCILDGPLTNLPLTFMKFPLFLHMREEIGGQLMKLVDFYGIFQIFPGSTLPKPRYPSQANSETKKV